jgi:uncharacterized protein
MNEDSINVLSGDTSPKFETRLSKIHGTGVFATLALSENEKVCPYVGRRISKAESLDACMNGNACIFALSETEDLDGDIPSNPARYINHSCDPNCDVVLETGCLWVITRRPVSCGEELTFNYGYDLTDWRSYPCRCGTARCPGYMVGEEFQSDLHRLIQAMR